MARVYKQNSTGRVTLQPAPEQLTDTCRDDGSKVSEFSVMDEMLALTLVTFFLCAVTLKGSGNK